MVGPAFILQHSSFSFSCEVVEQKNLGIIFTTFLPASHWWAVGFTIAFILFLISFPALITVEPMLWFIIPLLTPLPKYKDKQMDLRSQLFTGHFHWFPALHSCSEMGNGSRETWGGDRRMSEGEMTWGLRRSQQLRWNILQWDPTPSALAFLVHCPCRKRLSDFRGVGGEKCWPQAEGSRRNKFWNSGAWSSL